MGRPIRVLIADDHAIMRTGIISVLSNDERIEIAGEADNGRSALALFEQLRPDVVILDLMMPDMSGMEALAAIRALDKNARVIALTTYRGDALIRQAIRAGASGYMLKDCIRKELGEAIVKVYNGQKHIPVEVATELTKFIGDEPLSRREVEVLQLVARGNSNKRVGVALDISEETVKAHLKNIMAKVDAKDRTQAVIVAMRRGILTM